MRPIIICVIALDGTIYNEKQYDLWDINHNYTIIINVLIIYFHKCMILMN